MSLYFLSFGYKNGIPLDADFVFDARCLPNPHWEPALRAKTGLDPEVREFLCGIDAVNAYLTRLRPSCAAGSPSSPPKTGAISRWRSAAPAASTVRYS